ncbi:MAG: dTDP-4-dehydrorhamnose reductase [Candidatus Promineifilaceae bacterium]
MRIFITGGHGQLGRALQQTLATHQLTVTDIPEVDITNREAIVTAVQADQPDVVIHCAAWTDVDGCARDPKQAYQVNGLGTQNVALACQASGAEMVHISTNEVFSGDNPAGYEEWMALSPANPYGRSKAAAERHVQNLLNHYYIVRTAWLYAPGGRNFVHAILNRARTVGELKVVADEIGNPTNVNDLAQAIGRLIVTRQYGIYHFANAGACSRWAFAQEILHLAGLIDVPNIPILRKAFKRPSTPPRYGILHNITGAAIGITLRPWQEALAEMLKEMTE